LIWFFSDFNSTREKNDEKKVKKDGDVEDTDIKEGKGKNRVKKAEKNDEKEEEADSDSDTIFLSLSEETELSPLQQCDFYTS